MNETKETNWQDELKNLHYNANEASVRARFEMIREILAELDDRMTKLELTMIISENERND